MKLLLDTGVLGQILHPRRYQGVGAWLAPPSLFKPPAFQPSRRSRGNAYRTRPWSRIAERAAPALKAPASGGVTYLVARRDQKLTLRARSERPVRDR